MWEAIRQPSQNRNILGQRFAIDDESRYLPFWVEREIFGRAVLPLHERHDLDPIGVADFLERDQRHPGAAIRREIQANVCQIDTPWLRRSKFNPVFALERQNRSRLCGCRRLQADLRQNAANFCHLLGIAVRKQTLFNK